MTETYYQYQPDEVLLDIEQDDLYDHVLERQHYRKMASTGPKSMKNFVDMEEVESMKEHFTTNESGWMKHLLIIVVVLIVLYFLYSSVCGGESGNAYNPNKMYTARFVRT